MNNPKTNRTLAEIIKANLTEEQIKQNLGNLEIKQEEIIEQVLKAEDKQKITAYDSLEVKDLPTDWKKQLERKAQLEINQADYNAKKEELKGWTDTFAEQKPLEVAEKITKLEQRPDIAQATWDDYKDRKSVAEYDALEQELNGWKNTFTDQTPEEVEERRVELVKKESELKEWCEEFPQQTPDQVRQKITELEQKLNDWMGTWEHRELSKVKEEWDLLKKRPDIPITQQQWWNDYTRRKPLAKSKAEKEELIAEKRKVTELKAENKKLSQDIENILENGRTIRYMLVEPVSNLEQAKVAIEKLLEKTEKEWGDYLKNGKTENMLLKASCQDEAQKTYARQVLERIKEARETHDYPKLLEKWSEDIEYNSEYDFDGSHYLLKKYLEKYISDQN
jgi:hypothetical protein